MDRIQAFISSADTGLVAPMWTEMFLSEPVVSALAGADKSVVDQFLAKGVGVAPLLTPTTCAVRIEALTSTAMAASSSMEYSHAWVYSLALLCEVDPGAVALTDKQVEVAFKLKQRWQKQEKNPLQADAADAVRGAAAGPDGAGMAVDAESRAQAETGHDIDDEGAAGPLQWEDQPEPLAEDLKQVMLRFQAGVLSLDPRSIMDSLPVWEGVKAKVEANNYRGDASSKLDRVLASIQRKVLGLMRTYPVLHQGIVEDGELQVLGQQYWGLLLSLENFILSERKAHSIPGSIQPQAPQLFSKDDIKLQAEQASINKVSGYRSAQRGTSAHPPHRIQAGSVFPVPAGVPRCPTPCLLRVTGKGFKFRSYKGSGSRSSGSSGYGYGQGGASSSPFQKGGKGRSFKGRGKPSKGWCSRPATAKGRVGTHSGPNPKVPRQHPQWAEQRPRAEGDPPPVTESLPSIPGVSDTCCSPSTDLPPQSNCISHGESIGFRNRVGGHPPPSQASNQSGLVVQLGHRTHRQSHKGGYTTTVVKTPYTKCSRKAGPQFGPGPKNNGGVRICRSGKKDLPSRCKPSNPLVSIVKTRRGGGTKWRFISDCREINQHFQVEKFRLDHLQQIYPLLQKGHWGAKIDLKDAYFHLPVSQALRPYLCHKVGNQVWEYQAGPFGLNVMPQLFQKVMGLFERKWRKRGVQVYIYLDDILILGPTPNLLNQHLRIVVEDLINSGFKINLKKSQLEPSQIVSHLGFVLNFQDGKLQISPHKLKGIKKELGKFVTKTSMSKRQVAAILGQVRANLLALPFLRAFTTLLVNFLAEKGGASWDSKHHLSQEIKEELKVVKQVMEKWGGRPFVSKPTKILHSDSSDKGWGGINPHTGQFVQEYWREESYLHINVKEMKAAINTVQSLAKPNDKVLLCVDNQVIFYYLQKGGGGKTPSINSYNHFGIG